MLLNPRQTKFNKNHKLGLRNSFVCKNRDILFGYWGIYSLSFKNLSNKEIEAGRRLISKIIKKEGLVFVRVFPYKGLTKKPIEVRMGKGKGNISSWVYSIKPGEILYEVSKVNNKKIKLIEKLIKSKISVKCCLKSLHSWF